MNLSHAAPIWSAMLSTFLLVGGTASAQLDSDGPQLFAQFCSNCHGSDMRGGLGPDLLDDEWVHGSDRETLSRIVHEGVPAAGMPAFGAAMNDRQIHDVVDFLLAAAAEPDLAPAVGTDTLTVLDYNVNVEVFVDDLEIPWAIEFLDRQTAVVTERPGGVWIVRNGTRLDAPVAGTPEVLHEGQGGLLDVTADPGYAENGWIYLSYSHALPAAADDRPLAMTRIVRGRISDNRWIDQQVLFEAPHETYLGARHHYGSRIVFDRDGYLYFSIGDRGTGAHAQDLGRPNGKIHRIHADGSIPSDNPYINVAGALPTIYSYGHRNPQGLAIHPRTGDLWAVEHGPQGGDELNLVKPGRNYGWPEISYGINYDGTIMTEHRRRLGMEQPNYYWRPSIAVSGLSVYDDEIFPLWRDYLVAGALAYQEVRLLHVVNERLVHQEVILKDAGRVREAVPGPDGAIYVVLNDPGRVIRLTPRAQQIRGRL